MAVVRGYYDGVTNGSEARFYKPAGITSDGVNLYVVDSGNHTVRLIVIASGATITLAGSLPGYAGAVDDVSAHARFNDPRGITTDGANLYVADYGNHTIRKIDIKTATVNHSAGEVFQPGIVNDTGSAAHFWWPWGVTTDGKRLFAVDSEGSTVRTIE